jgi:hypothetical protein
MKLRLLGFYYLLLKKDKRASEFAYNYCEQINLQSVILFVAGILLPILFGFEFFAKAVFIIGILNLMTSLSLTDFHKRIYEDNQYKILKEESDRRKAEMERAEEERRRKEKEARKAEMEKMSRLRIDCLTLLNELRRVARAYNAYSEFEDNIERIEREVYRSTSSWRLSSLYEEIENIIRYIKVMYADQKQKTYEQRNHYTPPASNGLTNLLRVLGLDPTIKDMNVIKKRRKELAMKYHPDNKNTGDLSKMQEINSAFDEIEKILR